jgi:flagellar hook-basal body complex protein FliE
MSNMHIDSVLSQIRAMSSQVHAPNLAVGSPLNNVAGAVGKADAASSSFATMMRQGIDQVNQTQMRAGDLATSFERGTPGVELSDVMLEMQKASVSFRALTEVRNRFVNVYQEIMSMPI